MPKKIRELKVILRKAGFSSRPGKAWHHLHHFLQALTFQANLGLPIQCGFPYQEKKLRQILKKLKELANIRRDVQHKFTTELARTCGVIGIEDLNILGMMANRKLARAVADAAMGQLLQFLQTKVANAGGDLFLASRWFASTKRCSCCGHVKKRMPLKHRTYQCLACGLLLDRDLNAALNLLGFATEMLRQLHA